MLLRFNSLIINAEKMRYYIVDAFTSEAFGGNPAGVVLLGQDTPFPDERLMVQIAAELRYSETAFVQQNGPREFTVRYFTPCSEVDLCGHATIASFEVLKQEGIIPGDTLCLNHTHAGDLEVRAARQVMMQMAVPRFIERTVDAKRLYRIMAGKSTTLPVEIISTGLPDIIMPVDSLERLEALHPDMEALADLSRELGVVGVHAFAVSDDPFTAHVRNFAPLYGVPEESATGTANAALTHYLLRQGRIQQGTQCRFMQGEAMGRPSVVATMVDDGGSVWVGGQSRIIARGELLL